MLRIDSEQSIGLVDVVTALKPRRILLAEHLTVVPDGVDTLIAVASFTCLLVPVEGREERFEHVLARTVLAFTIEQQGQKCERLELETVCLVKAFEHLQRHVKVAEGLTGLLEEEAQLTKVLNRQCRLRPLEDVLEHDLVARVLPNIVSVEVGDDLDLVSIEEAFCEVAHFEVSNRDFHFFILAITLWNSLFEAFN